MVTKVSLLCLRMNGGSFGFDSSLPKIFTCNSNGGYIGGPTIIASPGYIKRTYKDLVPHDILYITLEFVIAGDWQPSDWFSVDVDGVPSVQWSLASKITSSLTFTCGAAHISRIQWHYSWEDIP